MITSTLHTQLMQLQANLLNFAYTLTNDRDAAYDLLQDTTVRALATSEKCSSETDIKGWVFTIMRNIYVDDYRRALLARQESRCYRITVTESTDKAPEGTDTPRQIAEALADFDPAYGQPFAMHIAGLHYSEIATRMKLPLTTIRSRIFMARRKLQQRLNTL